MAESIVSTWVCSDLLTDVSPDLEDRATDVEIKALSALLQPALELAAKAYQQASVTAKTEAAFRRFLQGMLAASD